jgi:hypothetical protein
LQAGNAFQDTFLNFFGTLQAYSQLDTNSLGDSVFLSETVNVLNFDNENVKEKIKNGCGKTAP